MRSDQEIKLYEQSIRSVESFVGAGYIDEALKMIEALEKAYPEMKADLLWEKLSVLSKIEDGGNILTSLIELYEIYNDEQAYDYILKQFVNDKKNACVSLYGENYKWLMAYNNFFGNIKEKPEWIVLYKSEDIIIAINLEERLFRGSKRHEYSTSELKHAPTIVEDCLFVPQIMEIARRTDFENAYNGIEHAVYLAFENWEFEIFMQCLRIETEFNGDRFFFLIEEDGVRDCFADLMTVIPTQRIKMNGNIDYYSVIDEIYEQLREKYYSVTDRIREYYDEKQNLLALSIRVKNHTPRILFKTSKYTTVLQYHSRNAMNAAISLGCECRLLIEPDGVRRITNYKEAEVIDEFHPDVIFILDHFRYESSCYVSDNIFFITWIQDPMDHILDANSKDKLKPRDIILNHIFSWKKMEELYPNRLIDAPVPANETVYKYYDLSEHERKEYSADICFVCHASDVDVWIDETLARYHMEEGIKGIFRELFAEYQDMAYEGTFFYTTEEFEGFIKEGFLVRGWNLSDDGVEVMADEAFKWLNQRVYRQTLVDWILEAGFENIKLWGDGWKSNPKYASYAMGPAENGETLSKIYQASKIVIGNNIMTTAAARAWESMLSGAFYLSNYIPPEEDWCDIRKIMPEDTVVFFKTKDELIDKIRYFLEHEDERKAIAQKCREEALKRMTFKSLMNKVLNLLPEYL